MAENSIPPKERINIVYRTKTNNQEADVELPLKLMVVSNLTGENQTPLEDREVVSINKINFDQVMKSLDIHTEFSVKNRLNSGSEDLNIDLNFESIQDFNPDNIINQVPEMSETKVKTPIIESIMQRSKYTKDDESYSVVKQGVAEFISNIITTNNAEEKINKLALDEMIAHIDTLLSAQMDEILHNKSFQELESTWRGIRFLVERTNFNENVKIDLLDATKEEILDDFENNLDITQSTLYKQIYSAEYGQFGGEPVGAIVADYELDKSNQDMTFLNKMSSIAAMSHSPLLTSLSSKFFGLWRA